MFGVRLQFALFLLFYAIFIRLVPYLLPLVGVESLQSGAFYPWNFSPVMAICLFGGATFASRTSALAIPLGALLLSDLAMWPLMGSAFAFYPNQPVVYASFALGVSIGIMFRNRSGLTRIAVGGLMAELLFFLTTNFGVWWFSRGVAGSLYTANFAGLITCYAAALPFLARSLVSTYMYSGLLLGAWAYATRRVDERERTGIVSHTVR
jgi:hypothetical protein